MEYVGGGVDYNSGPYAVQFNVGVTSIPLTVLIQADNILEDNETFEFSVNASALPDDVTVGSTGHTTVTIVDDNGEYTVIYAKYFISMLTAN